MAHSAGRSSTSRAWAEGGMIFAATMLMIIGLYQVFMGIAAIARGQFFVVAPNYIYEIDTTAWGWIHLGIGVLAAVTGFFLFTQATWARWVGIAMAGLSTVANFFFLPYYPVWSIVIIALNVFVIWSLATVGSRDRTPVWGDETAGGMPQGAPMRGAPEEAMAGGRWPSNPATTSTYDTEPSKGMTPPTGEPADTAQQGAQQAAQQGAAGATPPRPPTPMP
ncbi:DUF7144 family membrane protein [Luedemannella helvata]|uniref:DUF7144 domain-containing protein n=1 Tax=Luedemannella helvata TaxID=349315 RepID=A0ABN2L4T5_9ACTN